MEWKPIETAPEDVYVLIWEMFLDVPCVAIKRDGMWRASQEHVDAKGGWEGATVVSDICDNYVTHWMPLPDPPEAA